MKVVSGRVPKLVFTLTSGRTGTKYLAELLKKNITSALVYHERLGFDAFGVDTPDLSQMTLFNSQGNVAKVRRFWKQKFKKVLSCESKYYVETSHLLMKAGMVENFDQVPEDAQIYLIVLKRDMFKVVVSLVKTYAFMNRGTVWMWYLDPNYPKKIVSSRDFVKLGLEAEILWYVYEIAARQEYYKLLLKNDKRVRILEVNLEDLNQMAGVKKLMTWMGVKPGSKVAIPHKQNVSTEAGLEPGYENMIRRMIEGTVFDAVRIAKTYYDSGVRLG